MRVLRLNGRTVLLILAEAGLVYGSIIFAVFLRLGAEDATGQRLAERRWPDDRGLGHTEFFRVIGGWLREQFGDRRLSPRRT